MPDLSSDQSSKSEKIKEKIDLMGCSNTLFQRRIIHQLFDNINIEKNGSVWKADPC